MKPATESSLEPSGDAVKKARNGLLAGWELGALVVGFVLAAALLSTPRAAAPGLFPVPLVDVADERASRVRLDALAESAERGGLPFETRAVGDAVRRFGTASFEGRADADFFARLFGERVRQALRAGQVDALLRLRAFQARLFVRAVRAHDWSHPAAPELIALGGDFVTRARANAWVAGGRCLATDAELSALFMRRWSELTHLSKEPQFSLTLGDVRRYYRFLLLFPEQPAAGDAGPRERAEMRLRYAEALARRDTEYPIELARGSLLAQLGSARASASALDRHLSGAGRAFWNLRARNYLLFAARDQLPAGELAPGEEP